MATTKTPVSDVTAKIAAPIRHVLQRLRDDGVTMQNVAARTTTSYSNRLVRVDALGRVHAVIRVISFDPQVVSDLQAENVYIEQTAGQDTIQGWIPFDRVEQVAALSFVRDLRPPRYAIHR
jgi:protein gp37